MNPGRLMLNAPPPSKEKAVATIQAHWRGFLVRRTKPLEQLQVIYYVRQDLKAHMTVLADAAMYEKLCCDAQERLRWGECAMALLLRLDAVQGAHADVRDIRKMVTKEVVTFQEIVDSTSNDASSGKEIVVKGRRPAFQSLYFTLQQRGWIFISAKHLYSHL